MGPRAHIHVGLPHRLVPHDCWTACRASALHLAHMLTQFNAYINLHNVCQASLLATYSLPVIL